MNIRRAGPSDVSDIKTCVEASLRATYAGLWTSEPLSAGDRDWPSAWVACVSDDLVGVGLSEEDRISDLWIHPASQGRGIGTQLLAALEKDIAARGFATARLRCLEPNHKSRSFYVSRGWTEVRIYPHEKIPLNTVDMIKRRLCTLQTHSRRGFAGCLARKEAAPDLARFPSVEVPSHA